MSYIPKDAVTQSFRSNKGVLTPNQIIELDDQNKFTKYGQLELIQTQTVSTVLNVDFTAIQENIYNVHFATLSLDRQTTSSESVGVQFFENGTIETGNVYQYAYQNGEGGGTFGGTVSTTSNRLFATQFVDDGDDKFGYSYFYNLGDGLKYSFQTMHSTAIRGTNYKMRFGSGTLPQTSVVDGIRFTAVTGTITGDISLYGIRFS